MNIYSHLVYPDGDKSKPNLGLHMGNDYSKPDFHRCNSCGKDFTISKYKLWKVIKGIKYKSERWLYTT